MGNLSQNVTNHEAGKVPTLKKYPVVFLILLSVCCQCERQNDLEGVDQVVIDELERLGVNTDGKAEVEEKKLPEVLDDSHYGVVCLCCSDGGYDLEEYAEQWVTYTKVDIKGDCFEHKIEIFVISKDEDIACVYLAARENMAGGLYSINNEFCHI